MTILPTTPGGFRVIDADPPWSFRDKGSRIAPERAPGGRYATMDAQAIMDLPVREIAARDALLFLWTTSAHLLDGTSLAVARAWGFEPKTTMVWVKRQPPKPPAKMRAALDSALAAGGPMVLLGAWLRAVLEFLEPPTVQIGFGHYVRAAHEIVIVARRGKARVNRRDVPSVFFAPRGRHSAKPPEFLEIIERLCSGPRLELFARTPRQGWLQWGDEAPGQASHALAVQAGG